jgi:NTP pyrophosphatase (non-canonical NTP hydrolase)
VSEKTPPAITAETVEEAFRNAVDKGFWRASENLGEKIALMHSELSEALEELRKPEPSRKALAEEMADLVIRVMDFCGHEDLDLVGAVLAKMEINQDRPYLHDKSF